MKLAIPYCNLWLAWLWMLGGFVSGALLGRGFHHEQWLGGYQSLKRRLYRLGHISFFGLGAVNFMFFLTVRQLPGPGTGVQIAGWAFMAGALLMPLCCLLMAHWAKSKFLFAAPVISLFLGTILLLVELTKL